MNRWFRWYDGTTEDGKFRLVARKSRVTVRDALALWAVMLEDAADLTHQGVCSMRFELMESVLDLDEGLAKTMVEQMIAIEMVSGAEGSLTICNWSKRQFKSDIDETAAERQARKRERDKLKDNAPVTRDTGTSHAALDTDTESDTEKKEVEAAQAQPPRNRGCRLPLDFKPTDAGLEFARKRGLDPVETLAKFLDHWTAATGRGATKLDWDAAFRTWCRNEVEFRGRRPSAPGERGVYNAPVQPQAAKDAMRHMAYAAMIKKKISPGMNFSSNDRRQMIAAGMVTMEECEAAGCAA